MTGYIYIRHSTAYDTDNACKLGSTLNIRNSNNEYATCEFRRGYFEPVYEVPEKQTKIIERLLHHECRKFNIVYDGGTHFYKKDAIALIEPYLIALGIKYKKLTYDEINE